jgi:hypothetical protein
MSNLTIDLQHILQSLTKDQLISIQQMLPTLTIEIDRLIGQISPGDRSPDLDSLITKIVLEQLPQSPAFIASLAREIVQQQASLNSQSPDNIQSLEQLSIAKLTQPENIFLPTFSQRSQNMVPYGANLPTAAVNTDDARKNALQQLIDIYNNSSENFLKKYQTIPVLESQASLEKRRSNSGTMPFLSKARADRSTYLIVPDQERGYIFPDPNLVVNPHNLDTVEALFKTTNYDSNYQKRIQVIEPSIAHLKKLADNEEWIVVEKGSLIFM